MSALVSVNTKIKSSDQEEYENLITSAREGDLEAFNQLVRTHQDLAYNHANALLRDSFLAEDVTQESFIKAFQNIKKFRGGSFRAWLMRIITNTAYDMLRKSKRQPSQPLFPVDENGEELDSVFWLADPNASVQETVERKELSVEIYRLLDELPEAYRSVITLIDIFEMNYAEVAQALNIPLGTVKSRIMRARQQIKSKLIYQNWNNNFDFGVFNISKNPKGENEIPGWTRQNDPKNHSHLRTDRSKQGLPAQPNLDTCQALHALRETGRF